MPCPVCRDFAYVRIALLKASQRVARQGGTNGLSLAAASRVGSFLMASWQSRWNDRTMLSVNAMQVAPNAPAPDPDLLLQRYLSDLSGGRNLSPFTLRNYDSDLRHYLRWLDEEDLRVEAVVRSRFRTYIAGMQDSGASQGSVTRRVSTVKSFYRWLRLVGFMSADPLALVSGPKQAKRLPHVLTLENVEALIASATGGRPEDLRDRALLETMYASGLRVSEAHGLDVGDIDLDHRALRVRGKGNKERIVVVGGPAQQAIERYLSEGRPTLTRASEPAAIAPAKEDQPCFVNRFGGRLSQRAMQLLVRKYALKAGIDARVHPHLLRHSFATHMLDNGAELRVVQELLGHSNPNTTQIYLHVTEQRQRHVMEDSLKQIAAVETARRSLRSGRRREQRPVS